VIVGPTGSKFYLVANQKTFERGELENSPIQVPISYSFPWMPYVGI